MPDDERRNFLDRLSYWIAEHPEPVAAVIFVGLAIILLIWRFLR